MVISSANAWLVDRSMDWWSAEGKRWKVWLQREAERLPTKVACFESLKKRDTQRGAWEARRVCVESGPHMGRWADSYMQSSVYFTEVSRESSGSMPVKLVS